MHETVPAATRHVEEPDVEEPGIGEPVHAARASPSATTEKSIGPVVVVAVIVVGPVVVVVAVGRRRLNAARHTDAGWPR
jgi:hypothetical protein